LIADWAGKIISFNVFERVTLRNFAIGDVFCIWSVTPTPLLSGFESIVKGFRSISKLLGICFRFAMLALLDSGTMMMILVVALGVVIGV
jgi:hypothetical protein